MGEYVGKVRVLLKPEVPDNSGEALVKSLHQLGFTEIQDAKVGKYLEVTLSARNKRQASKQIQRMSETLFANPVIEEATTENIDRIPATKPQDPRRRKPKAE